MNAKHTISINGQLYDAITGLQVKPGQVADIVPVRTAPVAAVAREPLHHAASVHQHTQKSVTLRREHLATPKSQVKPSAPARHVVHVAQSPMIAHFASHPTPLPKNHQAKTINDIGPTARKAVMAPSTKQQLSSKELKERLIARAGATLDQTFAHPAKQPKKSSLVSRLKKRHLLTAGAAVILLAGYVAYLNVPSLSVKLAAAQSGVNATFPGYRPDGYNFAGPVAFQQGEVELHFKANGSPETYTIRQSSSNWNSVAVLDNLVSKASGGVYKVTSTGGITVYTYGTNGAKAAWTNGGVLYTVDGDAPLSSDQLVDIAASM